MKNIQRGTCRYCGCTEMKACLLRIAGQLTGCWWVDAEHTVCSSTPCYMKFQAERLQREKSARAAA